MEHFISELIVFHSVNGVIEFLNFLILAFKFVTNHFNILISMSLNKQNRRLKMATILIQNKVLKK